MAALHSPSDDLGRKIPHDNLWLLAVDPFTSLDAEPLLHIVEALNHGHQPSRVQAAFVLAPSSFNWTGEFNGDWFAKYRPLAQARLDRFLPLPSIEKVVVPCEQTGMRAAVTTLLDHAQRLGATCIVVATHARRGVERMALGSFAETLILSSPIPVLVLNPTQHVPQMVRKILVPVDLTEDEDSFAAEIALYARALDADVVLFHKQSDPFDPIVQQGVFSLGGGWVSTQEYVNAETESKFQRLEKLQAAIQRHEIRCAHVMDSSPLGLIESVDRAARNSGADMITVMTRSGPWSAALLGSVARGLVRGASVPVMVQRVSN